MLYIKQIIEKQYHWKLRKNFQKPRGEKINESTEKLNENKCAKENANHKTGNLNGQKKPYYQAVISFWPNAN
jgi:hypothetical protein